MPDDKEWGNFRVDLERRFSEHNKRLQEFKTTMGVEMAEMTARIDGHGERVRVLEEAGRASEKRIITAIESSRSLPLIPEAEQAVSHPSKVRDATMAGAGGGLFVGAVKLFEWLASF